ncbi:MAG: hypothetical protein FJY38_01900 [Betaproteobacteria bacterium]|nr:hypothetical protein [Betaproteobacteria bacterium]
MKIHVASDLHLEFVQRKFPDFIRIDRLYTPWADVLVLAGDIHNDTKAISFFKKWPHPVLYVPGNHEFYEHTVDQTLTAIKKQSHDTAIIVMDRTEWVYQGVRFLGCVLWTDYRLNGEDQKPRAMKACEARLADHRKIMGVTSPMERFPASKALSLHEADRAWLEAKLAEPFGGPTVVVTHHGPHPGSVHPRFSDDPCNAGFISDLTPLVEKADLWVHGHVHDSFDYKVGRCRVLTNPGSYAQGLSAAKTPLDLGWENPHFDPQLVVSIGE